jgi:hypothetical protein
MEQLRIQKLRKDIEQTMNTLNDNRIMTREESIEKELQFNTREEEYAILVKVLRMYEEEMSEEDREFFKDEYVQLDWNRRLLQKIIYDESIPDISIDDLDEEEYDNIIPFYTKEDMMVALKAAREAYDIDICTMDTPELCCDEI